MAPMPVDCATPMHSDALIDLLLDLSHDLGKYVRMPLAFLPADADAEAVREAVRKAVLETRQGSKGTRSARSLWEAFLVQGGEALAGLRSFAALEVAVASALAWEERLDAEGGIDRVRAQEDFDAVSTAIRAVTEELPSDRTRG